MTARPRCAAPDTPLSQVAELMETQDIGAIPIFDGDRLVGMITDRDIVVRALAKKKDPRGIRGSGRAGGHAGTGRSGEHFSSAMVTQTRSP
jgi:CBS domain-containing protein